MKFIGQIKLKVTTIREKMDLPIENTYRDG